MQKPNNIKNNSTLKIVAPSNGIIKPSKLELLDLAKKRFSNINVIEGKNVRKSKFGESATAKERAKELNEAIKDSEVDAIITVSGGDFLYEIMSQIDYEAIKRNPKWYIGQSDSTLILFTITTMLDIETAYAFNVGSLGKASEEDFLSLLNVLKGKFQREFDRNKEGWISKKVNRTGRIIGGTLDCIMDIVGTKYDNVSNFIEKYKEDKIIWYFDINYMTMETLLRDLLHLNNLGWFKYTDTIILGRTEEESFTGINLDNVISRSLPSDIDVIKNFDLGHTEPRITIINGSKVKISTEKEKYIEIIE